MKGRIKLRYALTITVLIFLLAMTMGGLLLAADISLDITTNEEENKAELTWSVNKEDSSYDRYTYTVEKEDDISKEYTELSSLPTESIKVLNVYPTGSYNASQTSGVSYLLKRWMEAENDEDQNGYGKGLIDVTPVSIQKFNANPEKYLYGELAGDDDENPGAVVETEVYEDSKEYKYDVIFFGSADSYGGNACDLSGEIVDKTGNDTDKATNEVTDLKKNYENKVAEGGAVAAVEKFINAGHNVIFGHDTIGLHSGQYHPKFAYLGEKYVGIITDTEYQMHECNHVIIAKTGVFTTYPWDISKDLITSGEKKYLEIPTSHCLGQHATGDIWLKFDTTYESEDKNFYLTTYRNEDSISETKNGMCAMIQTGHRGGEAKPAEEKVIANLIFYVATVDDINGKLTDMDFIDKDAPTVNIADSNIVIATDKVTINFTAEDKGTEYKYKVTGVNNVDKSEIKSEERIVKRSATGIAKFEYVIDGSEEISEEEFEKNKQTIQVTEVDGKKPVSIEETIDCTIEDLGKRPETYLHIRAIDAATSNIEASFTGNKGTIVDKKIYENEAPEIKVIQTPTEWINDNVTLRVTGTDTEGQVESITGQNSISQAMSPTADGTYDEATKEFTQEYSVSANGDYTFVGTDNGQVSSTEVVHNVSNIDTTLPQGEVSITSELDDTGKGSKKKITVNNVTDNESGIARIKLVDENNKEKLPYLYEDMDAITKNASGEKTDGNKKLNLISCTFDDFDHYTKVIIEDIAGNETSIDLSIDSAGVEIKYIDSITGKEISTITAIEGKKVGESYTTTAQDITGYKLVAVTLNGENLQDVPTSTTVILTVGKQTIVYEYKKESKVITKYIDDKTEEEIAGREEKTYLEGDPYTASAVAIKGYSSIEPKEITGTMGIEDVTVTFRYRKISNGLLVKYVDEVTGKILEETLYGGNEGEIITPEEKEINGYKMTRGPEEKDITLKAEAQEVTYYYKKIIGIDIVGKDIKTGKEISRRTQEGLEGDDYTTTPDKITGYKVNLEKLPENQKGTYSTDSKEVVYLYNKIAGGVKVQYVDIDTNEVMSEEEIEGLEGELYQTEEREFEGYNFVKTEGEVSGEMAEDEILVKYYYKKISTKGIKDNTPKTGTTDIIGYVSIIVVISIIGIIVLKKKMK